MANGHNYGISLLGITDNIPATAGPHQGGSAEMGGRLQVRAQNRVSDAAKVG